jgi:hypothetical protein
MKMEYEYTDKLAKKYSIYVWESKITKYIDGLDLWCLSDQQIEHKETQRTRVASKFFEDIQ